MTDTNTNNTFDKTLRELRHGSALTELSESLAAVVAAVRATGKKGKLKLELSICPASKGETVCVMIEDTITTKLPQLEKPVSVFYSDEQNMLHRVDPRQKELELRSVPTPPTAELRQVQGAA